MLEVLDDAINLRDERDAPLTLTQWPRCKRKRRGSPANPPPFEPREAGPGRRQLHVQVLWTERQSGRGHLAPLWGPGGAVGTAKSQAGSYFSTSVSPGMAGAEGANFPEAQQQDGVCSLCL